MPRCFTTVSSVKLRLTSGLTKRERDRKTKYSKLFRAPIGSHLQFVPLLGHHHSDLLLLLVQRALLALNRWVKAARRFDGTTPSLQTPVLKKQMGYQARWPTCHWNITETVLPSLRIYFMSNGAAMKSPSGLQAKEMTPQLLDPPTLNH